MLGGIPVLSLIHCASEHCSLCVSHVYLNPTVRVLLMTTTPPTLTTAPEQERGEEGAGVAGGRGGVALPAVAVGQGLEEEVGVAVGQGLEEEVGVAEDDQRRQQLLVS